MSRDNNSQILIILNWVPQAIHTTEIDYIEIDVLDIEITVFQS